MKDLLLAVGNLITWKESKKNTTWTEEFEKVYEPLKLVFDSCQKPGPGLTPSQLAMGIRHPRYLKSGDLD